MIKYAIVLLLYFVFSTKALAAPGATQVETPIANLVRHIDAVRHQFNVPAAGFTLVSGEDVLWAGALGITDVETRQAVSDETQFRIGSITKAFTSLALLMLEEDGKLALNDPLHKLVKKKLVTNPWRQTHPVRLAHLLEHTAGLTDISAAEFDHNDPSPISLVQALDFQPQSRRTRWPPGLHSSYSNAGAGVAGYVIEQYAKQPYESFITQKLFNPLGMSDSGFFLLPKTKKHLAKGYQADGKTPIPYWHMIFRPFGGINTRPVEMAAFLQILLNKGVYKDKRLLRRDAIRRMEVPQTTLSARSGLTYGYGLGNYQWLHKGALFHGHGGDGDGYLARFAYNRDSSLGYFIVVTVFNHKPLREMQDLIENYIVHTIDTKEATFTPPPVPTLDPLLMQRYTGVYKPASRRFPAQLSRSTNNKNDQLHVYLRNNQLYTRFGKNGGRALIAVNRQHFRRQEETIATMAFVRDAQGHLFLQGDMGNYRQLPATTGNH